MEVVDRLFLIYMGLKSEFRWYLGFGDFLMLELKTTSLWKWELIYHLKVELSLRHGQYDVTTLSYAEQGARSFLQSVDHSPTFEHDITGNLGRPFARAFVYEDGYTHNIT